MCFSIEHRDHIFVKGYGFLPFVKSMGKNIGRNISKNSSSKYSQKRKYPPQMHLKLLQKNKTKAIQITAEGMGDLIGKKVTR